jgi:hypothetical protein
VLSDMEARQVLQTLPLRSDNAGGRGGRTGKSLDGSKTAAWGRGGLRRRLLPTNAARLHTRAPATACTGRGNAACCHLGSPRRVCSQSALPPPLARLRRCHCRRVALALLLTLVLPVAVAPAVGRPPLLELIEQLLRVSPRQRSCGNGARAPAHAYTRAGAPAACKPLCEGRSRVERGACTRRQRAIAQPPGVVTRASGPDRCICGDKTTPKSCQLR